MRRLGAPFKHRLGGAFSGKAATWQVGTRSQRPDNMFVLLPLSHPRDYPLCDHLFTFGWRDGHLARLAGGDAHRSIDVATGRDERLS